MRIANNEQKFLDFVEKGMFEIDSAGKIWRLCGGKNLSKNSRYKKTKRVSAERVMSNDYLQIRTIIDGRRCHLYSHRIVWTYLNSCIPDGFIIDHIDGNKQNNSPTNLDAITFKENKRKTRGVKKERLTKTDVIEIRNNYNNGRSVRSFYRDYNTCYQSVNNAAQRKTWKGVM